MILSSIFLTFCTVTPESKLSFSEDLLGEWVICSWGTEKESFHPAVCSQIYFKQNQVAELITVKTKSVLVWEQFGNKIFLTPKGSQKSILFRDHSRFEYSIYEEDGIRHLDLEVIGSDFKYTLSRSLD